MGKIVVIALGGNALIQDGQKGTITEQFANTRMALDGAVELLRLGLSVVITHGNGPQAGFEMIKNENSEKEATMLPLGVIDAETQGSIGYMIAQSLMNRLKKENIDKKVAVIITQVLVNENDLSIKNPKKFVGKFYKENEIDSLIKKGWIVKYDMGRGYRRVVPSPEPIGIIEKEIIIALLDKGYIVIAAGGGGIPVYYDANGNLEGLDAVIDKDKASALLAEQIGADEFYILTAVKRVCINFRKANEQELKELTLNEAKNLFLEGQFPAGSMGPKIEAALRFVENTGKKAIIGSVELGLDVVKGNSGTLIKRG
ncbi:MAG: carbamate kinase [bacterium (Candidatus Stahlbacteria) CG23_combo_of_CG06-09_8_20_14_all_34_7]|nr:MAG: carbamate kinase [bacterium (Candidatus Stahlbacteria) CG23_combo_of_CG06-09_8_20_14_all_34_7]